MCAVDRSEAGATVMDAAKAAYQVQNLTGALEALAMTNIRSVIGEMDLDATLSGRERINSSLLLTLDGATHTEPFLGETLTEVRFVRS